MAAVFAEVLGVERVGLDDDFFDLGGNSLIATQVVARLGAALDTRVPVRVLFEASTVGELAVRVEQVSGGGAGVPLVARVRPEQIPLSLAQQRMWFLNQFDPGPRRTTFRSRSGCRDLDVDALQAAVVGCGRTARVAAHGVPGDRRSRFQQVLRCLGGAVVDGADPERRGRRGLEHGVAEIVDAGFDVTDEVPFRVRLLESTPDEYVLVVVVHHISGDGFSMGPLTRDVMTAYAARAAGRTRRGRRWRSSTRTTRCGSARCSAPRTTRSRCSRSKSPTGAVLWRICPISSILPSDRPRPAVRAYRGDRVEFRDRSRDRTVSSPTSPVRSSATLFMVVHAASRGAAVAAVGYRVDIAIGTPIAGRGDAALDDLVGMFVNTLVLRTSGRWRRVVRGAARRGPLRRISRRSRMRMCRSSGWSRCSILRVRRRGIRCSR